MGLIGTNAGKQTPINDGWEVCSNKFGCYSAPKLPHEVLSLFTLDPNWESTEHELREVGLEEWTYSKLLPDIECDSPGQYSRLYFNKIDTIAIVKLNGQVLGEAKNSLMPQQFEFRGCAKGLLTVAIQSSLVYTHNQTLSDYPHTVNYHVWDEPTKRNLIRKPASHFGWDWGPAFPAQALGKVYVETGPKGWAFLALDQFRVDQTFSHPGGGVEVCLTAYIRKWPGKNFNQTVSIRFAKFAPVLLPVGKLPQVTACFVVTQPKLWFPRGSFGKRVNDKGTAGRSYLYNCVVEMDFGGGKLFKQIGLRQVKLNPHRFEFEINREVVDWRGVNLVPFDVWQFRYLDAARLVGNLLAMNINAVRVWGGGGGDFLPPSFYDECDRAGIMVWQDLPWACALFPIFPDAFKETVYLTRSKQSHPSVLVWGGNNEVEAALEWFAEEIAPHRDRFVQEYLGLFMGVVKNAAVDLGGAEVYLDSSPSNGLFPGTNEKQWGDVTDPTRGDIHFYNYSIDCSVANNFPANALFVSEFGFQSLPSILSRYVSTSSLLEQVMWDRLRHEHGLEEMHQQAIRSFGGKVNYDDVGYVGRALLSQVVQGKCLAAAIGGAWRPSYGNSGTLIWQLNDVWPGASWSLMEFDWAWKASAYAVRYAFAPVRVHLERTSKGAVSAKLQWFREFIPFRSLFGFVVLRRFDWSVATSPTKLMVLFKVDSMLGKRQEAIWESAEGKGFEVCGGAVFAGSVDLELPLLTGEWLEPLNGRAKAVKEGLVTWEQQSVCQVAVFAQQPQAHVWLHFNDTALRGRFSMNGFLLLPGERQLVDLVPDPGHSCNFTGLRVASVVYGVL
ncbi:hypothetical protein BASA81_006221 [Batrachochytrium salamandrivorans]|nr:hypothetical protein BASA81_006221 [Batrachochytrium salamandrivorans]